ncbi:Golgi apparatus protein 1 isoform X1 [Lucilia sericata]|uniref:Golgi apparatus protein 1 isoform X1 n=1 Tax=Lucilia sericata TaxID=13632 RepID=UPI0018A83024|nr:Golgi apparatus protein 1 isoform X1 [Lucilia sericata]
MKNKIILLLLFTTGLLIDETIQQAVFKETQEGKQLLRTARAAVDANLASKDHSLIDNHDCEELKTLCTHIKTTDNLAILECVSTFTSSQLEAMPDKCQHAIWQETKEMIRAKWVEDNLLKRQCAKERDSLESCINAVDIWTCIKDRALQLEHGNKCRSYIKRVHAVFFPDFENLGDFFNSCSTEIDQLECGRLNIEHKPISQLETVDCLQQTGADILGQPCKLSIARIELQEADLKFFEICSVDLKNLCPQEVSGTPGAFKCLVKNKSNPAMTNRCSDKISQRDREIAKDYRISHGLAKACKDDIKLHHCRRGVSEDKQVRLAQILLCLETVEKNGTKIAPECRAEIDDHRRMLMSDGQLSPEILNDCADDIPKFCGNVDKLSNIGMGQGTGGEIIHCLMEHARKRRKDRRITSQCQRSLENLIKVSDVGEDWRVDPVLRRNCKPVVDVACRDTDGGDARVMSCLMEQLGTPAMTPDCEHSLLLIQYFVARDFKLDPQLYKHCHDDAIKYCHAKKQWDDVTDIQMDPERGPLILPCLHRMAYSDDEQNSLRPACFKEVKRVMRQRAVSVDLIPEVEDACIEDLSYYCFENTGKGAEMDCLQIHLEKLQTSCREAVTQYTEEEAAHVELNPVIMSVCTEAMKTHCSHILKGGKDKGDMMDCLISHKNDADLRQDLKCRAAIEHFQIISLKNYHFTYKFKEACRPYVVRFCSGSRTKNDVVACLSEVMRNDTIRGQRPRIPKECRQQVKAQLYQQRESLALDPKLANACSKEIEEFCSDKKGPGEVNNKNALECLAMNTPRLGNSCHHAIFLVKKSELGDSATDYTLINTCKEMTYKYCSKTDPMRLLDCLKTYKDDPTFDARCHLVVVNRMIEQNTDFRFNPTLQLHCGKNIDRYCSDIVAKAEPNEELNGKVIQCLKDKFRKSLLDEECSQEMVKILQEQALNYKLNPLLQTFCKHEIAVLCHPEKMVKEHGLVEECLKNAFLNEKIINKDCRLEVATLIAEAKADIHVDPILEEACTDDLLRYCSNVKKGNGRKLKCLQTVLQDHSKAMEQDCRLKLQKRIEMFRNADTVLVQPPENMEQLVNQVVSSPAKKFFIVILMTAVGMIFIMGIFLGRVTKRAMNTKNK